MKTQRVNERISAYRVVLILSDGQNKGEMLKSAALDMARRDGLDLVEVSPGPVPVCKIIDFGKMLYERSKKEKKQHTPVVKEIRMKYATGDHDLDIKKKKITEFLEDGHKVLVFMKLSGRERYVGQGSTAKEKFISLVKQFSPTLKMSDIQESEKGLSCMLHPSPS